MICSWFALAFSINSGTLNINVSSVIDNGGCRVEPVSLQKIYTKHKRRADL